MSMLAPGRCTICRHIFDAADAQVTNRYHDCTVFKCPRCHARLDDRPIGWGGSFEPLTRRQAEHQTFADSQSTVPGNAWINAPGGRAGTDEKDQSR